jgi:indolepyruvate ferredoxin oxidoreductase alpha subunit
MSYVGLGVPIFAFIGDSTFYHTGIMGLINAANQKANINIILGENQVTAMTGFQPHPGTGELINGELTGRIDVPKLAEALGIRYWVVNPYSIKDCQKALEESIEEEGVSLIVSSMPCYLLATRKGQKLFEPREIQFDEERCNGCMVCILDFGCPAISYDKERRRVSIDRNICVGCGLCIDVCKRGAIT